MTFGHTYRFGSIFKLTVLLLAFFVLISPFAQVFAEEGSAGEVISETVSDQTHGNKDNATDKENDNGSDSEKVKDNNGQDKKTDKGDDKDNGKGNVIIPGTNYNKKGWDKSNLLYKNVNNRFGGTTWIYNDKSKWSGGDNRWARSAAAGNLVNDIKNYNFVDGEPLNIIGHSHGGNIGYGVSNSLDRKIDTFITLGTPARGDYKPNMSNISQLINVYSGDDKVQPNGGGSNSVTGIIGRALFGKVGGWVGDFIGWGEFGKAGRTIDGATNINVSDQTKWWRPRTSHTELWQRQEVWHEIEENIK